MVVEKKWHLVLLRRNQEKKISEKLSCKGIETYFPAVSLKKLSGLEKGEQVISPVFPSHLFVNIQTEIQFNFVKHTKGILNFYYNLSKPAIISESDIIAIQLFVKLHRDIRFEKAKISLPNRQDKTISDLRSFTDRTDDEVLFLPTIGYFIIGALVRSTDQKIIHLKNETEIKNQNFFYSKEEKKTTTVA